MVKVSQNSLFWDVMFRRNPESKRTSRNEIKTTGSGFSWNRKSVVYVQICTLLIISHRWIHNFGWPCVVHPQYSEAEVLKFSIWIFLTFTSFYFTLFLINIPSGLYRSIWKLLVLNRNTGNVCKQIIIISLFASNFYTCFIGVRVTASLLRSPGFFWVI